MIPVPQVRGGTGLKIRLGDYETRGSKDLDLVISENRDKFISEFSENLIKGWNGFTGEVIPSRKNPRPVGVPINYVMGTIDV
jgi:hypothetical protein